MLIRVNGRHDGVKRYLEDGQKKDREQSRDQLDERVTLAGDLELTDAVIQSIRAPSDVDRYLHITMSFKEDYVAPETIYAAVEDLRKFVFAAYRPDELNFYAEAHLPRLKSYVNRKDGTVVERKPHVHIVIPKANLMTGKRADPIGYVPITMPFIDAVQEQINARYGFASPKDYPRTQLTGSSEMISRYRGDLFGQKSRTLKTELLDALLDRQIESYSEFLTLLSERGAVRMRNAGRANEYPNIKLPGEAKGINLKETVFSRDFMALSTDAKLQKLGAEVTPVYLQTSPPRPSVFEVDQMVDDWMTVRARETKYLNSGNKSAYSAYQALSVGERVTWLDGRERQFYHQHPGSENERGSSPDGRPSGQHDTGVRRVGRKYGFKRVGLSNTQEGQVDRPGQSKRRDEIPAFEPSVSQPGRPSVADAKRWERGARRDPSGSSTESLNGLRSLSRIPVVRFTRGSEVLLPDHASRLVEHPRPQRINPLRRDRDSERKLSSAVGRWDKAYPGRGGRGSGASDSTSSWEVDSVIQRRQRRDADQQTYPGAEHDQRHQIAEATRFGGRKVRPTGRISDSAISQRRRDAFEVQHRVGLKATDLARIAGTLPASQLLIALSHSHGVLAKKYVVVPGPDGLERILAGDKALDVFTFLTKELHLPRPEAATVLRDAARYRPNGRNGDLVPQRPDETLWREYNDVRLAAGAARQRDWSMQRHDDRRRWAEIKEAFEARRAMIKADPVVPRQARRSALSIARIERLENEGLLRAKICSERAALAALYAGKVNRTFLEYLQDRAQTGDIVALRALRQRRRKPMDLDPPGSERRSLNEIRPHTSVPSNEVIYQRPMLSHHVRENGDVTYRYDGRDVVHDRRVSVQVTEHDRGAIEIGLRLAMAKYGHVLQLNGSEVFKREALSVSVEVGLRVKFSDEALNTTMTALRTESIINRFTARKEQTDRDNVGGATVARGGLESSRVRSNGLGRD